MASNVAIKLDLEIDTSKIRQEGQSIGNILQRSLNKNTRVKALDNLEKQIVKARDEMHIIQGAITRLMNTPIHTKMFDDAIKQAQQYKAKVKEAVDYYKQMNPAAAGFSNKTIVQALESSKRFKDFKGGDILGTKDAIKGLRQAQQLCNNLVKTGKAFEINQGAIDILKNELGESEENVRNLLSQLQQLSYTSGNSIQNMVQPLVNFNQEISQTMGSLQQAFGPYIQAATTAMSALVKVTEMEIKALAKVGEVAISAFKPLVSMAELAGKTIGGIFDSIKKHNETTMKNLWRNILRYGIGVRSMYFLIRKVRQFIGETIQELAKQIPEVNAKMSEFKTALNGLKGAFASAFQPILSSVLPILTKLIQAVTRAINIVGQFIALLTGQNFVYKATAVAEDYAQSLKDTGKEADKAKKKLEGYLSPIDEINKYQSEKDDAKDKGGSDGGGPGYKLEKAPIESWIKDFWEKLKGMWETGDFYELGKTLGDKLAEMLANIPWDKIRENARKLGKSLATFLNGVMDGEFDGQKLSTLIGKTFAQAINTAFEFLLGFVKNFNWKRLGEFISEALIGVFDNLDWNLITEALVGLGKGLGTTLETIFENKELFTKAGDALARSVNAMIYSAFAFLNQLDGKEIGTAISSFINAVINRLDLSAFVQTCNKLMNLILDTLITAVQTTDWSGLGTKLVEAFNKIDFVGIFKKYSTLANSVVNAILDTIENFLKGLTPEKITEIATSIADAINGLDFQPKRLGTVANNLLQALLDIAVQTVTTIDWNKIAVDIATFLSQIDWQGTFEKIGTIKSTLAKAFLKIVAAALSSVFVDNEVKESFASGEGIANGIVKGFESVPISNPILKGIQSLVKLVRKEFNWLKEQVHKILNSDLFKVFKEFATNLGKKWTTFKTNVENKFTALKNAVVDIAKNIKKDVSDWFTKLKDAVVGPNSIIEKFKSKITELFNGARTAVEGKVKDLKKNVSSIFTNLKNAIVGESGIITTFKTTIIKRFNDARTSIEGKINTLKENVKTKFKSLKDSIVGENGIVTKMKESMNKAVDKVKEHWRTVWGNLKTSVVTIFTQMWNGVKRVINTMLTGVEKMANGIIKGINSAIDALNGLSFEVPEWVPEIGGSTIGFEIPKLSTITIPKLAQGAVIPPNREFLATLGDQKSGTNIETPLATMVEAFNMALKSSDIGGVKQINFLLPDRRTLAQYTIAGGKIIQTSTGRNPFDLA